MGRFSNAELTNFRNTSHCSACVHYSGCQLWLALLLMNEELGHPGLDLIVPDITRPCPMFFPWTAESARRITLTTIDRTTPHQAFRSGDESHSTSCVRRITAGLARDYAAKSPITQPIARTTP
jgi:hypothetical protein